jgi:hypothetical protein
VWRRKPRPKSREIKIEVSAGDKNRKKRKRMHQKMDGTRLFNAFFWREKERRKKHNLEREKTAKRLP